MPMEMLNYEDSMLQHDIHGTALYDGSQNDTDKALSMRNQNYVPMMAKNQSFVFTCFLSYLDEDWENESEIVWEMNQWNLTYVLDKAQNK